MVVCAWFGQTRASRLDKMGFGRLQDKKNFGICLLVRTHLL